MENNACNSPTLRIIRKNPDISWMRVWRNLQTPGLSDSIKCAWHEAIHDILPTHQRLAALNLVPTMSCAICAETYTLAHRISQCNEGPVIWNWIRARMAAILRVQPSSITKNWTLFPTYTFWPPKKPYGNYLDAGPPRVLPTAISPTTVSQRLSRIPSPSQMEGISATPTQCPSRQIFGNLVTCPATGHPLYLMEGKLRKQCNQ
jgi:hypothetical protein